MIARPTVPVQERESRLGPFMQLSELPGEDVRQAVSSPLPMMAGAPYPSKMNILCGWSVRWVGAWVASVSWRQRPRCAGNGEQSVQQKAFGMQLSERGFKWVENNVMIWHGIG